MSKSRSRAETLEDVAERYKSEQRQQEWAIEGWLPHLGLGVLFGRPGTMKTFTVVDLAVRMAVGLSWGGLRLREGVVAIVAAEDPEGVEARLLARAHELGFPWESVPIVILTDPPPINSEEFVTFARTEARAFGNTPISLVAIDNLSATFDGRDQEGSGAMSSAMRNARHAANALGCAVLLVHHPPRGNDDVPAGGAPIERAPDLILHQTVDGSGEIRITARKVRAGPIGGRMLMRAKVHRFEIGDHRQVIETLVLYDHQYLPPALANARDARDSAQRRDVIVEVVERYPNGVRTSVVLEELKSRGFTVGLKTVQRELADLSEAGRLKSTGKGAARKHLVTGHRTADG